MSEFAVKIEKEVGKLAAGEVVDYKTLCTLAGSPNASLATSTIRHKL